MSIRSKLAVALALAASVAVIPASAQNFNLAPNYGTVNLRTGFPRDPHVVNVRSGGNIDASRINANCRGFISDAPDVRLNFVAGSRLPLIISADSGADTTIVVNGPDGRWYCDDDGGERGMNPSVRFSNVQSGRYEIWVGTYGGRTLHPAQVHISELTSQ
ncbi:hypothetical protein [Sphingosinicella sp.]|uniref:hypothetical protein n=1 Tax=Sphingosinicella sp. TaxID=1917971 RepID=UPI004037BB50